MYELMFDPARIERAPAEAVAIESLLGVREPRHVLDVCCGPGRHSIALALRGHRVVGVDRTARYLQVARERAAEAGADVEFVVADAREYISPQPVDVVLNLWTSFGYFADPADNLEVLRRAHKSLHDGGRLVLQIRSQETMASHRSVPRTWWERDGVLYLDELEVIDDWRRVRGRWVVIGTDGVRHDYRYISWLYSAEALAGMLTDVGFRRVRLYGDLAGAPYDLRARYLVAVAEK